MAPSSALQLKRALLQLTRTQVLTPSLKYVGKTLLDSDEGYPEGKPPAKDP